MKIMRKMRQLSVFDRIVIAGGLMNLLVIEYLFFYWLLS